MRRDLIQPSSNILFIGLREAFLCDLIGRMAENYLLHVTAGPSYDPSTHQTVHVNSSTPLQIRTPLADVNLHVRIQNYRGNSCSLSRFVIQDSAENEQACRENLPNRLLISHIPLTSMISTLSLLVFCQRRQFQAMRLSSAMTLTNPFETVCLQASIRL